jgi:hypothetical protein
MAWRSGLVDVAQDMNGFDQTPELGQGVGQAVGGGRVGEALHDNMGRRHPGFQRRDQAYQLIPLLDDDADVDGATKQWLQRAVVAGAVDTAEDLVRQVLRPRHEGDAEQNARAEQVLGEAVRIGRVFADDEGGVVVENAAEHVAGFARRAGDCLRRIDAVQVGSVGIEGERAIVVAEVAGIEAAQQAIALYREALPIGGGAAAVTPDAAEWQAVMVIDQDRVGRLQRRLAQEPPAGVLQRLGGDRALAKAGDVTPGCWSARSRSHGRP